MKFAVLFAVGLVTINLATATDLALVGAITVGAAAVAGSALLLAGSVAVGAAVGRSLFRGKRAVSYCFWTSNHQHLKKSIFLKETKRNIKNLVRSDNNNKINREYQSTMKSWHSFHCWKSV